MAVRAPIYLSEPSFWAEEGSLFFAVAWEQAPRAALTYRPTEYLVWWANLATTATATLVRLGAVPLARAPLVTVCFALAAQLLPVAVIAWSRAPFWGGPLRRVVAIAIVLFGVLTDEIWLNTVNSQHWLVLAAALLVLEPPAGKRTAHVARAVVLGVAASVRTGHRRAGAAVRVAGLADALPGGVGGCPGRHAGWTRPALLPLADDARQRDARRARSGGGHRELRSAGLVASPRGPSGRRVRRAVARPARRRYGVHRAAAGNGAAPRRGRAHRVAGAGAARRGALGARGRLGVHHRGHVPRRTGGSAHARALPVELVALRLRHGSPGAAHGAGRHARRGGTGARVLRCRRARCRLDPGRRALPVGRCAGSRDGRGGRARSLAWQIDARRPLPHLAAAVDGRRSGDEAQYQRRRARALVGTEAACDKRAPCPASPTVRHRQRHPPGASRRGRRAGRRALPRIPGAGLLLAPSGARAGRGRLPRARAGPAWLRRQRSARGDRLL